MRVVFSSLILALTATLVTADNIYIQVAGTNYSAEDNTTTFTPQRVTAQIGDIVFFNFTSGNHSATQSTFASPCQPAHDTNITINGFDSGFRDTVNGTAVTILSVPILDNNTVWFYDGAPGACGSGAVGTINNNESSLETLAGFERNAERLNGSAATSSSTTRSTSTASSTGSNSAETSSGAQSTFVFSGLPLALFGFALSFL